MKMKKGVKGYIGNKINLHKAYDRIDWYVLLDFWKLMVLTKNLDY